MQRSFPERLDRLRGPVPLGGATFKACSRALGSRFRAVLNLLMLSFMGMR